MVSAEGLVEGCSLVHAQEHELDTKQLGNVGVIESLVYVTVHSVVETLSQELEREWVFRQRLALYERSKVQLLVRDIFSNVLVNSECCLLGSSVRGVVLVKINHPDFVLFQV
uniref:Uncharacterized protein n=1 Tax=Strombidium inclinatum TaxID=197538 RepID=A0A7S3MVG3_9SPIT